MEIKELEHNIKVSIAIEHNVEMKPFIFEYENDLVCILFSNGYRIEKGNDYAQLIHDATGVSWININGNWILKGGII
jgi:hypothetical protein